MGGGGPTRTIIFDLTDLDNPIEHFQYLGTTNAIDHNGYVKGNRFYLSSYRAGMRIIKIDDIDNQNMTEVSYFDTWPSSNSANFDGAWNVYPFFESGNLIISNYNTGFFIVKDPNYDNVDPTVVCQNITATLNSTTGSVTISALDVDGGSTDNIGITVRSIDITTFTCNDLGSNNVTLTVEDDYGNKSSCVTVVTVEAETTTYFGGSWSPATPGAGSDAKFSQNYNTSSGDITACSCEVDTGVTVTVGAGEYLDIEKDITVNGTLIIEHQGSVVQTDANALVTNNGTINVNLSTPNLASRDFLILGSPMTGETRGSVWSSAFLVLDHNTLNFVPNPAVAIAFPGAENFADDNYDNWIAYNNAGTIDPGEGYLVRPQAGYGQPGGVFNYTYDDGTLNNGIVNFSVLYNTPGPTSADNKNASPNVLANPYPSAIFADDFIGGNAMVDEVYFWEHLTPPSPGLPGAGSMNFSMEDISMYNLSGGVPAASDPGSTTTPNGYISTGQGFGIKATAAGTATFTNSMRRTTNNNTLRDPLDKDRVWISVNNADYDMQNTTLIAFTENATPALDNGYDSRRLATVVSLYSHLEDGSEELGIQSREAFESGVKIPMGFSTQIEAELEFEISIANIEGANLESATLYLIDNYTNEVTNLSEGSYTFKSNKGTFHNRFTLQFEAEVILGSYDNSLEAISIFPNPTEGLLNIISPNEPITGIEVYNVIGRRIYETHFINNSYKANLESLETGIYFVKITTEVGQITKKIIKE
jgi:type IX secretion system substrate protein